MNGDGPKMVHFGPKMANHGRLVNVPKGPKMVNLSVFDHLGPSWAHMDPFGPFQTKINFLPQMDNVGFGGGALDSQLPSLISLFIFV